MRPEALVMRPELLRWVKRPETVNYWTGGKSKTIPCSILSHPPGESTKDGFVWIEVAIPPPGSAMKVQVRKSGVMMRHKFIRPWLALDLVEDAENLSLKIRTRSNESRIAQEAFEANGVGISQVSRH